MHGLPGSGKSTRANEIKTYYTLNNTTCEICSADSYFIDDRGRYNFDPTKLHLAHKTCIDSVIHHLSNKVEIVIVDNTNLKKSDIQPYVNIAERLGITIISEEPSTPWKDDPITCSEKTVHQVPLHTIERMKKLQETPPF